MLTPELIQAVHRKLEELVKLAETQFNRSFPIPKVAFDIRGKTAGYANRDTTKPLRFNPILLKENGEKFINRTVGHEFAHFIQFIMFPNSKGHGPEWKLCMRKLGLKPSRCHNYDVTNAQVCTRKHTKYPVSCPCKTHMVTIRLIRKIQLGKIYRCPYCRQVVKVVTSQNLVAA